MKKSLALLTLAAAPAFAGMDWNDCCDFDCNFSIGAEAIYWKPCTSEYVWGSTSTLNNGVTTRKNLAITPDYQWGFRLFGTVSDQCEENAVMLSWTYLYTSDSTSKKGEFFYNPFSGGRDITVESAKAKERFRYHNVKLRGMHDFCKQCDSRLYAYAGARYVYIQNRRKATAVIDVDTTLLDNLTSKFSGGGIEVGFGGEVGLWCDFGLAFEAGIVGLVGERRLDLESGFVVTGIEPSTGKTVFPDSRTICMPGVDAKLGLTWGTACWCLTIDLEVGYQIEYYFDPLFLPTPGTDPRTGSAARNVGFAGPYFGIILGY